MTRKKKRKRTALIILMVATVLLQGWGATKLIVYHESSSAAQDYPCQGHDRKEPFRLAGSASNEPDAQKDQNDGSSGYETIERADRAALIVACQANAIARNSMTLQLGVFFAGLVPLWLGALAVFIAVWQLVLREEESQAITPVVSDDRTASIERSEFRRHHKRLSLKNLLIGILLIAILRNRSED